jgi:hypothetical protein
MVLAVLDAVSQTGPLGGWPSVAEAQAMFAAARNDS